MRSLTRPPTATSFFPYTTLFRSSPCIREPAIASLRHQGRQAELPVGSDEWLLAVIGAVAAQLPRPHAPGLPMRTRRALLEERLRSEEHTSELQSQSNLVCRLLLE